MDPHHRTVVITGASSGIGHAAALALAERGYRVFAGVRRESDAAALRERARGSLEPIQLDVTDPAAIAEVRARVAQASSERGLFALINNAGVSLAGPVELMPLAVLREQFEVNVFGLTAMIQALLPALRVARGRIVNIGSIGGFMATPLQSGYCATKFALEGLSDSLRRELQPFGISVSLIRPGSIDTRIWEKGTRQADELLAHSTQEGRALYADWTQRMFAAADKLIARAAPPEVVTRCIVHALEARHPRARYEAGVDAALGRVMTWALPDWAVDRVLRRFVYGAAPSAR